MRQLSILFLLLACLISPALQAEPIRLAAAADLKFALDEIIRQFQQTHPGDRVEAVYGSSGKLHTQIQQGAPYDLFFSADLAYLESLSQAGLTSSPIATYGRGRIVLWRPSPAQQKLTLEQLQAPDIKRIALANPKHAPYGKRAEEALRASKLWDSLQAKLVYGENIAQAAQFVQTGNAQIGIIALSLARHPSLAEQGLYSLIPESLHTPLEQGFVLTQRAAGNPAARRFAAYMADPAARRIMHRYGFRLPGETQDE